MAYRLYKRKPDGPWWASVTSNGQRSRRSTRTNDKAQAEAIASKWDWSKKQEEIHGTESILTFGDAVTLYLVAEKSDRFVDVIYQKWQNKLVKDINDGMVKSLSRELYPAGSPATRNRQVITPVQAIINHSAESGLCSYIRIKRFPVKRTVKKIADHDWLDAFVKQASPHLGALAIFMAYTGARISEAINLDWEDVDLQRAKATLVKTKVDPRICSLPPRLVTAMANIDGRKGKVFKYKDRFSHRTAWRTAVKNAKIDLIWPHAAGRYMFADQMNKAGVDPKTGAAAGGWKSARVYMDIYAQAADSETAVNQAFGTKLTQGRKRKKKHKGKSKS